MTDTGEEPAWAPLKGLTVIDFSMLLPGPMATSVMADLGAEVIKVEPPQGDPARHMKSPIFSGSNRNKQSIAVDLKAPGAAEIVARLAGIADVAVEGFRPGVAARLGCDAASLQAVNPRIVCCSLSGYGQTGPLAGLAGHDVCFLATGGGLSMKAHLRQPPGRGALPFADMMGGAFMAIAILSALREREATRKGAVIDISLYESVLFASALRFGFEAEPGSVAHLLPGNDVFRCADGRMLALAVVEPVFWDNLLRAAETAAPGLRAPEFATEAGRAEHAGRLMDMLDRMFATRGAAEWAGHLQRFDVPAAVCVTNGEAIRTEQARERALHVGSGAETVLPFPAIADGRRVSRGFRPPPDLGADGPDILERLGFGPDAIRGLTQQGTVRIPDTD